MTSYGNRQPIDSSYSVAQPPLSGAYIILAGPGTGKTTLLTERVLHIIESTPDERSKILALTFTNRAAAEMRTRLRAHGDHFLSRLFVGTFHGFATHVLRSHGDAIGLASEFAILDQSDQRSVLQDLYDDGEIGEGVNIDSIVTAFSRTKSRGPIVTNGQRDQASFSSESLEHIHQKYQARLKRSNALDFGDLIIECLRLFADNPGIRNLYRTAYPYVVIDEFQDTTPIQFNLLKEIIRPEEPNAFAVADEDQLIFEWNEARLETVNLYLQTFDAQMTYSTLSHRCPPVVVEAANAIIATNRFRVKAKPAIQTRLRERGTIFLYEANDEEAEASFVAAKVQGLHQSHTPLSEIAVIGRSRRVLQAINSEFDTAGIAAGQPSTAGLSGDEDGEAILRLLRWLQNPRDEQSARRVIQYLRPSLGNVFDQSVQAGLREGLPLETALAEIPEELKGDQVRQLLGTISQWRLLTRNTSMLISSLRNDLPNLAEDSYKEHGIEQALTTMETLLHETSNTPHTRLTDFLASLPVIVGARGKTPGGAVSVLTFHQAKGLEFTSVFIVGMADGVFPDFRSTDSARSLEEERRLFYVGLTRTKRDVFLTLPRSRRTIAGRVVPSSRSRFVSEIPRQLLTQL